MHYTPRSELDQRIARLRAQLVSADCDGALILQNADLFYLSGTAQQSHLYVPADGHPLLMTRKSHARARLESALESVVPLRSPRQLLHLIAEHGLARPRRVAMELDVLPVNPFRMYQQLLPGVEIVDCSAALRQLRAVKSAYELALIRRTAEQSEVVYRAVPDLLREGMTELDLAGQLEAVSRRAGNQGVVHMRNWNSEIFYGHLLSGANAAVPSFMDAPTAGPGVNPAIAQGANDKPIRAGEPVLIDYLFASEGYLVDQTRIYVIGELPADLHDAHRAMLAVQAAVVDAARPGVDGAALWQLAAEVAANWGVQDHFMGYGDDRVRFVGHGVGLELDELPVLAEGQTTPLEEGMVVALEPKCIFPGRGVVGIENTHVVTPAGLERLTRLPDDVVSLS
jgi:Xaa-Pro aminopeptidase